MAGWQCRALLGASMVLHKIALIGLWHIEHSTAYLAQRAYTAGASSYRCRWTGGGLRMDAMLRSQQTSQVGGAALDLMRAAFNKNLQEVR